MKIKYLFYIFIFIISSCANPEPDFYNHITEMEVRYSDNKIDTITHEIVLYKSRDAHYQIMNSKVGFFGDTPIAPCLATRSPGSTIVVASDIRRFKIISQHKHPFYRE